MNWETRCGAELIIFLHQMSINYFSKIAVSQLGNFVSLPKHSDASQI